MVMVTPLTPANCSFWSDVNLHSSALHQGARSQEGAEVESAVAVKFLPCNIRAVLPACKLHQPGLPRCLTCQAMQASVQFASPHGMPHAASGQLDWFSGGLAAQCRAGNNASLAPSVCK